MLRMLVCAVLGLALATGVGLSADKGKKGKGVHGKFESFQNGVLTITTKKKGEDAKKQDFKISEDTKVVVVNGDDKKETTAKDGFKDVKAGTPIQIKLGDDDKVASIVVGKMKKKKNQ